MQATEKIWLNGELVDWADAKVHVASHGLHYGSGVFEGIRCYDASDGPAVFRLRDHLVRLENSGKVLYMDIPYSVEELAAALDLSPGTVVHHLKRLRAAGLVDSRASHPYVEYSLRLERLHAVGRQVAELEGTTEQVVLRPGPDGRPLPAFDARVLRSFFEGDRLVAIPAQDKKKLVVLRYLRDRCFTEERAYPEKEVNQRLALFHPDVASLRRYMIEFGLMTRATGEYRRA